jgi:CRISPR system Cascade subunit CasC
MFVEIHLIQNFSPANLNRDDTNTPKDCEFGGVRRARISSQCFKKSIRNYFNNSKTFQSDDLSLRTKRIAEAVSVQLEKLASGKSPEDIAKVCEILLGGCKIKLEDGMSQYLLFLGEREIASLAEIANKNFDELLSVKTPSKDGENIVETKKKTTAKDDKKSKKEAVNSDIVKQVLAVLDGGKAVDLALFGRMIADLPEKNMEAACQVAHAISTHRVAMESDYFTAIDDLKPADTSGAGMLGTVDFNSSCFYRYAIVDLRQLTKNLHNDQSLAVKAAEEFINGMVHAIPSGKQNSMAAHNLPSAIMIVIRSSGQWSLANAFEKPVRTETSRSLLQGSIEELCSYYSQISNAYGNGHIKSAQICVIDKAATSTIASNKDLTKVNSINELLANFKTLVAKGS